MNLPVIASESAEYIFTFFIARLVDDGVSCFLVANVCASAGYRQLGAPSRGDLTHKSAYPLILSVTAWLTTDSGYLWWFQKFVMLVLAMLLPPLINNPRDGTFPIDFL